MIVASVVGICSLVIGSKILKFFTFDNRDNVLWRKFRKYNIHLYLIENAFKIL